LIVGHWRFWPPRGARRLFLRPLDQQGVGHRRGGYRDDRGGQGQGPDGLLHGRFSPEDKWRLQQKNGVDKAAGSPVPRCRVRHARGGHGGCRIRGRP